MRKLLILLLLVLLNCAAYSEWSKITAAPNGYYVNITQRNDTLYLSGYNNGVVKSTDGGLTWQMYNNGLSTVQARNVTEILLSGNILYASTVNGIYKSTDAGASWIKKSSGIVISGATYEFCNSIYELNGNLFTGAYTGIYRSTNGGESWIRALSGSAVIANNFTLHEGVLYAARETNNTPNGYTSTDNGMTWAPITGMQYPIITYFSEPNKLWAGTIVGAYISTNNGASWTQRNNGLSADPYNSSFVRVNNILVSSLKFGGSGIYKTSNDGLNWIDFGDGLPFLSSIDKLYIYNGKILAATSDGLWQRNVSEVLTSVSKTGNAIPVSYSLYQNYPNPFNPSTKIKFDIPYSPLSLGEGQGVRLIIYNTLGKQIDILLNKSLLPGSYEVTWETMDVPSGIYYYTLSTDGFRETKKMILLK